MKQLFSASLTWNETVNAVGTDVSNFTDEEHLKGNRKRLNQLSKRSGTFPAIKPQEIDCNPPSTAVAATSATFDAPAQRLASFCQQYIKAHSSFDGGCVIPTSEISPDDPRVITGDLPVVDFEPPKVDLKSGLSGSFPRQNSGSWKMTHWTQKKLAGTDALCDARVSDSVKEYEKSSKYTTSSDRLPLMRDEHREGESFVEFDTHEETPAIERFARGEAKMLTDFNNQGGSIRRLHSNMKMIECRSDEAAQPVEPSNSFDVFSSFVGLKAGKVSKNDAQESFASAMQGDVLESFAPPVVDTIQETVYESSCEVIELIVITEEPIEIHDDLDALIADCICAAKSYEDLTAQFDNAIDVTQTVISCAPSMTSKFNLIDFTGNIAVTVADSVYISESSNVAGFVPEQLNFDPKSVACETIEMNFVEQVQECDVEIQNVTMLSSGEYDAVDFAAASDEPVRKAKGSRSKKAQQRREKRSKKRDGAVSAANA